MNAFQGDYISVTIISVVISYGQMSSSVLEMVNRLYIPVDFEPPKPLKVKDWIHHTYWQARKIVLVI